jgi:rhamnose transport system substrate-binding protein
MKVTFTRVATAGIVISSFLVAFSSGSSSAASTPKKTIEFIQTQTGIPYYNPLIHGFKTESAKLGLKLIVTGPSNGTASSQITYIQQAIVRHVNGIAIQPDSSTAPLPALRQAKKAGIKIVETNVDSLPQSVRVAGVTALDYSLVAPSQLAELGKLMNYTGDFAILSASSTSVFQNQVVTAMQSLLKTDPKYANMTLVKVAYGDDVSATSATQTAALLTEFPNLKAITSPTTVGLAAAAQAVESANMGGKIIVTGLGEPIEMKKFILDKTVTEYQLWDPANMGIVSAFVLAKSMSGKSFAPGTRFQVPGSGLGTLKVAKDGNIPCQPGLTTFNLQNVNKYNF